MWFTWHRENQSKYVCFVFNLSIKSWNCGTNTAFQLYIQGQPVSKIWHLEVLGEHQLNETPCSLFYHSKCLYHFKFGYYPIWKLTLKGEIKCNVMYVKCLVTSLAHLLCTSCERWRSSWQNYHPKGWEPSYTHIRQDTWGDTACNDIQIISAYLYWLICCVLQSLIWRRSKCSSSISSLRLSISVHCFSTTYD